MNDELETARNHLAKRANQINRLRHHMHTQERAFEQHLTACAARDAEMETLRADLDRAQAIAQSAYAFAYRAERMLADEPSLGAEALATFAGLLRQELDGAADQPDYRPCICFQTPHLDLLRDILMVDGDADYADGVLGEWQSAVDKLKDSVTAVPVASTDADLPCLGKPFCSRSCCGPAAPAEQPHTIEFKGGSRWHLWHPTPGCPPGNCPVHDAAMRTLTLPSYQPGEYTCTVDADGWLQTRAIPSKDDQGDHCTAACETGHTRGDGCVYYQPCGCLTSNSGAHRGDCPDFERIGGDGYIGPYWAPRTAKTGEVTA